MGCDTGDSEADSARGKKLKHSLVAGLCGVQETSTSRRSELGR